MKSSLMPVIYIPHGGGPLPLLGEPRHKDLIDFLMTLPTKLPKPDAILMVSAHWVSDLATISSSHQPDMIYDYGGFPPECYQYQYPAKGNPTLAKHIENILSEQNINCKLDSQRGFDHGAFVPLMLMYPNADIPVIQLSLLRSMNPDEHIAIGEALSSLREEGVLIIGSGMSFDNMHGSSEHSHIFDNWLTQTLAEQSMGDSKKRMSEWEAAPSARESHPHEDHLLPAHVCLGAASKHSNSAEKIFSGDLFGLQLSGFLWR